MPAWLLSALAALKSAAVGGPFRALATGAGAGQLVEAVTGFDFLPGGGGGGDRRTRRRRRRALTASDRADIAFIVGMLGQSAGSKFAVTLATRPR